MNTPKIPLYERIVLARDVPEEGLCAGDVATLLDYVPHPSGGEEGCNLEVFNTLGESIMVATVPISAIEPLRANEIWSVRILKNTA